VINTEQAARRLAATMIGACAARCGAGAAPAALASALAAARLDFVTRVVPAQHAAWERTLRLVRGEPPLGAWMVVVTELRSRADGLALMAMFEYRDDVLCANGSPIADLTAPAWPTVNGVADLIAEYLTRITEGAYWDHHAFVPGIRGDDASDAEIASFVARCCDAGVVFAYRARPAGSGAT